VAFRRTQTGGVSCGSAERNIQAYEDRRQQMEKRNYIMKSFINIITDCCEHSNESFDFPKRRRIL
jgi:hypothetical protein